MTIQEGQREERERGAMPILDEEIFNLIIKDGEALKMNMPAYVVKIEVQVPTKFSTHYPIEINSTVTNKTAYLIKTLPHIITSNMLHCIAKLFT